MTTTPTTTVSWSTKDVTLATSVDRLDLNLSRLTLGLREASKMLGFQSNDGNFYVLDQLQNPHFSYLCLN